MAASLTSESNPTLPRQALDLVLNAAVLMGLYLAYDAVRQVTADEWSTAFENGRRLIDFQQSIGLPAESSLQRGLLTRPGLFRFANTFYMGVHFPFTAAFLFGVWFWQRALFGVIRNSLIMVTTAGLILHVVFPLAPPRFFPGFVDTAAFFGPNPYELGATKAVNQIAAMPSLHVGWAVLVAISVIVMSNSRWRYLIIAHPVLTTSVVLVTANHYWADAIIAVALVAGSWRLTRRLSNSGRFASTLA